MAYRPVFPPGMQDPILAELLRAASEPAQDFMPRVPQFPMPDAGPMVPETPLQMPPGAPGGGNDYLDRLAMILGGMNLEPSGRGSDLSQFIEGLLMGGARGFSQPRVQRQQQERQESKEFSKQQWEMAQERQRENVRQERETQQAKIERLHRDSEATRRHRETLGSEERRERERLAAEGRANKEWTRRETISERNLRDRPVPRGTLKPPSAGERTKLVEDLGTIGQTDALWKLYDKKFVGPRRGRVGALKSATGQGVDPKEARFRAEAAIYKNRTINFITGATVGQGGETRRLLQEIPDMNDPSEVFEAKFKTTRDNIMRLARLRRETMEDTGIDLSRMKPLPVSADDYLESLGQ